MVVSHSDAIVGRINCVDMLILLKANNLTKGQCVDISILIKSNISNSHYFPIERFYIRKVFRSVK